MPRGKRRSRHPRRRARAATRKLLPYARQWIDARDVAAVARTLRADFVTQGPAIERFEAELARLTGARHAVVCSSGTAALHLVCAALDVGPAQTGVTSPITFAASANCFRYVGAGVAFADVDPVSGLLTATTLDAALLRERARGAPPGVVIAVSLAGRTPDLPALAAVCERHGWSLVEDAAHSLGATYSAGRRSFRSASCAHTRAAILSFHPVKHICTGEGGAVLTNDEQLAARLRRLRSHGIERPAAADTPDDAGGWWYQQTELGFNYRLTDIQAALGASQLRRLAGFLARRRALARRYARQLCAPRFRGVFAAPAYDARHAYHLYVVHFRTSATRRAAYEHLAADGIRAQVHYIPVYRHPYYRSVCGEVALPGAEAYYRGCLSLPLFPKMTVADQDRVIASLAAFAAKHG